MATDEWLDENAPEYTEHEPKMKNTDLASIIESVLTGYIDRLTPMFQEEARLFFAALPGDCVDILARNGFEIQPLSTEGATVAGIVRAQGFQPTQQHHVMKQNLPPRKPA